MVLCCSKILAAAEYQDGGLFRAAWLTFLQHRSTSKPVCPRFSPHHAKPLHPSVPFIFFSSHHLRYKFKFDKVFDDEASGRKSPLATKNLLEDTDGLRRPPFF